MKYRKKPVVIEAMQCIEPNTPGDIVQWAKGTRPCGVGDLSAKQWIEIETLEGTMRADYGDWIIKGINQGFYYLSFIRRLPLGHCIFKCNHQ